MPKATRWWSTCRGRKITDLETDPVAAVGEQPLADDGLYVGDAIHLFLSAKRAGGSSSDVDGAMLRHPFCSTFDQVVLLCPSDRPNRRAFALVGIK